MPRLSAPSRIVTDGRTWSLAEYARFLCIDAGWSIGDAARETGLYEPQVRSVVTHTRIQEYVTGSLRRGVRPFVRSGTKVIRRADEAKRWRDRTARRLEAEASRLLAHAASLRR